MFRFAGWTVPALAFVAAVGAQAAPLDKLDVQLTLATPVVQGDADVAVDVAITNTSGHAVKVLKWQLPSSGLQGQLFRITKEDGSPARYVGPLIKRAKPQPADYVTIEAGATLNYQVELAGTYELGNGRHTIEYLSRGRIGREAVIASAMPTYLWTSGRTAKAARNALEEAAIHTQAATITYTGSCTTSEKSTLSTAVSNATTYATESYNYLAGISASTARYKKWFGTYSSSRKSTVKTHYANEVTAFTTKTLTLDCSCSDTDTYAYVYPDSPYKIYLCGAFWDAPATGTDSKAGTLVHEMSHFTVVAGTDDWAYGQTAAASLAVSSPTKAIDNADSHEYFSENNPFLN